MYHCSSVDADYGADAYQLINGKSEICFHVNIFFGFTLAFSGFPLMWECHYTNYIYQELLKIII